MKTKDVIAQAEIEFEQRFGGEGRYLELYNVGMNAATSCDVEVKYWIKSYTKDLLQSVVELQDEKFNAYLAKFSEDRPPKPAHIRKYLMEVLSSSLSDIITNIK